MMFDAGNYARENSLRINELLTDRDRVGAQHRLDELNGKRFEDEEDDNSLPSLFDTLRPDGHRHHVSRKRDRYLDICQQLPPNRKYLSPDKAK